MTYQSTDLCTIQLRARQLADAANVAYWTDNRGSEESLSTHQHMIRDLLEKAEELQTLIATLKASHPMLAKRGA